MVWRVVGLYQVLAGTISSSGVVVTLEIFFLGLGLTVTEIKIKKSTETRFKTLKM